MKNVLLMIALALVISVGARANEPASPPAAAPASEAGKAATASTTVGSARKSRRTEDARHCLALATNAEIIKCAEAYL